MFFTKKEILPISLIIAAFILGIVLSPYLSDLVPSHWNAQGQIDDWSSKEFIIFFFPVFALLIYLLMTFLPLIDPLKKNYSSFSDAYFWLRTFFTAFFIALYLFMLSAGLGFFLNVTLFMPILFSLLFIILGVFMPKIKKNYFVGIKTPWTIHSEQVWDKTHEFSGKLYIVTGLLSLLGIFAQDYAFFIFISLAILSAVISAAYSYIVFKRLKGFEN